MENPHSFHIPVMGIAYTIDTPLKVAPYGIDSVISLVDDILLEKLRKVYSFKYEIPYKEISNKIEDFRAKRITSYLNLINDLAEKKFDELKQATTETSNAVMEYFDMLPSSSSIKEEFKSLTDKIPNFSEIGNWLKDNLSMGSIDVNIMTKLDRENFKNGEKRPTEYNDAHAALRGFANSNLRSSIILSAGMNPRLYSYIGQFDDFFPDENGDIKKKIVLKVSDYRSAIIQGKFLAKKGLWVSEYRIESGLNCGGHAFATDGFLLGPILEEFKNNREIIQSSVFEVLVQALSSDEKHPTPQEILPLKITVQGGVGTSEEHEFLLDYYNVDSVGWGTPFLLVPEVTTVDDQTRQQLAKAKEKDLYLSDISPLGVPFNNLRGNTKDRDKLFKIEQERPGSSCPKQYIALDKELKDEGVCKASRQYQKFKINELDTLPLSEREYREEYDKIVEKSCICVGLGTAALLENDLDTKVEGAGISICPGPNMAYFSKILSLKEMTDHIYNRTNVISRTDRPNMFIKELGIYINYLKGKIDEVQESANKQQKRYLTKFVKNMDAGIQYYQDLFSGVQDKFQEIKSTILLQLDKNQEALNVLNEKIEELDLAAVS